MASREELLVCLWTDVINGHLRDDAFDNTIANCARSPDGSFGDTGPAIKRILDAALPPATCVLFFALLRTRRYSAHFTRWEIPAWTTMTSSCFMRNC